MYTMQAERILY